MPATAFGKAANTLGSDGGSKSRACNLRVFMRGRDVVDSMDLLALAGGRVAGMSCKDLKCLHISPWIAQSLFAMVQGSRMTNG